MTAIKSPGTLFNLLKMAKKAYQKKEPEQNEEEKRHVKITQGLTRLKKFALKAETGKEVEILFEKERKGLVKFMAEQHKKLRVNQSRDPNKAQLPAYLKKFAAILLAIRELQYATLDPEEEENPNLSALPDKELSEAVLNDLMLDSEDPVAEQPPSPKEEEVGTAQWLAARIEANNKLRRLQAAVLKAKGQNSVKAVALLEGIVKRLSVELTDRQAAADLANYLRTDAVVTRAHKQNPFGIVLDLQDKLPSLLDKLQPRLAEK